MRLEFTVHDPSKTAVVGLEFMRLWMRQEYAQCEDAKVCLNVLNGTSSEDKELRQSNVAQFHCLNGSSTSPVCDVWRACLDGQDDSHTPRLLRLLKAAGVTATASVARSDVALIADSNNPSAESCVNPPNQDPESWDCDCHDRMLEHCEKLRAQTNYDGSTDHCLRSQLCEDPRLCDAWKQQMCGSEHVLPPLPSTSQLLMTRAERSRSIQQESETEHVESSFTNKRCV